VAQDSNYVLSVGLDDFFEPFGGLWEPTEIDADGADRAAAPPPGVCGAPLHAEMC
jgi:hypothetical protein